MARRIAVGLQKGGVGKTSITVNLAAALAISEGLRVAVIDMDGQRNATFALLGPNAPSPTLEQVLQGEVALADALVECHHSNLSVLPGTRMLPALERACDETRWARSVFGVRDLLREEMPEEIDVVLIDTPPAGGLWLQAAFAAAHGYLTVAWPEPFSAEGIRELLDTVDVVKQKYNPQIRHDGLIINHHRRHTTHDRYTALYRDIFREAVLEPVVPVRKVIADAAEVGEPVEIYEPRSDAAEIFRELARTLAGRLQLQPRAALAEVAHG